MNQETKFQYSNGIGFTGILTIIFVIAKLFGKITWSWWWVFSPLWIGFLLAIVILAVFFVILFLAEIFR